MLVYLVEGFELKRAGLFGDGLEEKLQAMIAKTKVSVEFRDLVEYIMCALVRGIYCH